VKPSEGRINKLYPELTARERAVLVLRAWKEDAREDSRVRTTMPESQYREFDSYIDLMNGTHSLSPAVVGLGSTVEQLALRFGWLRAMDLWALHVSMLASYIALDTKEPITESEHQRKVEAVREEMAPVKDLAEYLADQHEDWGEDDMEEVGGEELVTDAAWERVVREKTEELAALVEGGVLRGAGKGRRLRINEGSFYDWLGGTAPVFPDWGFKFEVRPDSEAQEVGLLRRARERARQAVVQSPLVTASLVEGTGLERRPRGESAGDDLAAILEERVCREARHRRDELAAFDSVLGEVAARFAGEDPLMPQVRASLESTRSQLDGLLGQVTERLGDLGPVEPNGDLLAAIRQAVGLAPTIWPAGGRG
jgi:hypothetical protein